MTDALKSCSACGVSKPPSDFYRDRHAKDGLRNRCRTCVKAYDDSIRDRRNEQARERYAKDPGAKIAKTRAYHLSHPEWSRERLRASYEKHSTARCERIKQRLSVDLEFLEYRRALARESQARRRAQQTSQDSGPVSRDDYARLRSDWDNCCWICEVPLSTVAVHWDHYRPLSMGGAHVVENLRPACAECNVRKSSLWPFTDEMRERVAAIVRAQRAHDLEGVMP